jgi:acetyltransferase-like isoleucine patch superfamily enzyme
VIINGRSKISPSVFLGDEAYVKEGTTLDACGGYIRIDRGSTIAQNCLLLGMGGISLGEYVMVGPGTVIISGNHRHSTATPVPFSLQGSRGKGITIGNNVWIGGGAIVLDGVSIGSNCVVGAGAVISRSVCDGAIVTGPREVYGLRESEA